jgi:RNA polymerase sigma-70 factor (ECF subfamily)
MTTRETDLKALMLASLEGNAASYRSLLANLSGRLRAYYKGKLTRLGRGATEAEDLVQEVLLAIHLKRHTYDIREPFTPWVHTIARYKLIDYLRRTRSGTGIPLDETTEVLGQDDSADAESSHDIRKLLERLPEKVRCSIENVKLEGRSVAETAKRCGISESGVKINIHRGLRALANFIRAGDQNENR